MDALVRLYTTGRLRGGDSEYDRRAAEVDARRNAAEAEIARLSGASSRVEEMEAARHAVLEMWGTGLSLGVYWMPPRLRRQVYGLLGLGVTLDAENTLTLEGRFDADLMRLMAGFVPFAATHEPGRRDGGRLGDADHLEGQHLFHVRSFGRGGRSPAPGAT